MASQERVLALHPDIPLLALKHWGDQEKTVSGSGKIQTLMPPGQLCNSNWNMTISVLLTLGGNFEVYKCKLHALQLVE